MSLEPVYVILSCLLPVGVLLGCVWLYGPTQRGLRALEQRLQAGGPIQRDYQALRDRVRELEGQLRVLEEQRRDDHQLRVLNARVRVLELRQEPRAFPEPSQDRGELRSQVHPEERTAPTRAPRTAWDHLKDE